MTDFVLTLFSPLHPQGIMAKPHHLTHRIEQARLWDWE